MIQINPMASVPYDSVTYRQWPIEFDAMPRRFRFFNDPTYHFQTLRALNDIPYDGADTSEILETIKHITAGDSDSWYSAWERTGNRVSELAGRTKDPISRGRAHLR